MIAYLQSLAPVPGVEYVLLVSHDGVPIAHAGGTGEGEREQSLAALAAAWLNDIVMAVGPLTWSAPRRVCLRAARGTLVLRRSECACLGVVRGRDAAPEDVRLPMDGVLARVERARTSRGNASAARDAAATSTKPIGSRTAPSSTEEQLPPAPQRGDSPGT